MQFRKKPLVVNAEPFTESHSAIQRCNCWADGVSACSLCGHPYVMTHNGPVIVKPGDWLITRADGEVYPCNQATFEETYEAVE
jgi:hypothetical protein